MAALLGLGSIVVAAVLAIGSLGPGLLPGQGVAPGAISDAPSPSASPEARSPSPGAPVIVTGASYCTAKDGTGTDVSSQGMEGIRDLVFDCAFGMSDPRLTGTGTVTSNIDCPGGDPCFFWGTQRIDGPSGGWDCSFVAMEPTPKHDSILQYFVCRGTGGYEELTFISYQVFGGDALGYIYEGPPPVEIVPTDE